MRWPHTRGALQEVDAVFESHHAVRSIGLAYAAERPRGCA